MTNYLGIDFGTTGARAIAIDGQGHVCAETEYPFAAPDEPAKSPTLAQQWKTALFTLIEQIPPDIRRDIARLAINGTSSTVLLCDETGEPLSEPILYNDGRGATVLEQLKAIAPPNHVVLSATSSLAKLLWLMQHSPPSPHCYFLHQADWLAFLLHNRLGISDDHNALKLGYDPEQRCYPAWMEQLSDMPILPQVLAPGTPVGEVTPDMARSLGLSQEAQVCAGTTDSIAAFLASGAEEPGEAVTSLGSTLVLKLLSRKPVEASRYGIYSHRLGDLWLAGGASNTGGAVLRHFFSDVELERLSQNIEAEKESTLDYYPLLKPGERFPINDPQLPPKLEPKPADSVEFLHGLLESMARIEAQGYQLLQQLGATPLARVYTAGGGAKNPAWTTIRERQLQVPILPPARRAAAYGTARLARGDYTNGSIQP